MKKGNIVLIVIAVVVATLLGLRALAKAGARRAYDRGYADGAGETKLNVGTGLFGYFGEGGGGFFDDSYERGWNDRHSNWAYGLNRP